MQFWSGGSDAAAVGAQRRWLLRRRLGTAFAAVGALLAVFVAIVVFAGARFVRTGNDVINRWQPAEAGSNQILADLVNQQTGVRGYEITRQQRSLQPYTTYRAQERVDVARLHRLVANDRGLTKSLDALEAAAAVWRTKFAEPVIASGGVNRSAGASPTSKRYFDRIRARSATLTTQLSARASAARAARTVDGWWTVVFAALAALMVVLSGLVLWRGLNRWVLAPVERLAAQTRNLASGSTQREIVPDGPGELTELGRDVEAMRLQIATQLQDAERNQEELRARSEELTRSNDDLQQFAYVASHDLSEPLRKVANFCQLLERQYGAELDDRARQYIDFAVDGAKRMQALITDLLSLSRVGRNTDEFIEIDLDAKLDIALSNLGQRVPPDAVIERPAPLPKVWGDRALLISLLENLVGNALKYRRDDVAPVVRVSAELDEARHTWTVTVSDNGIGVEPEYAEKIFAVFQRLHLRDQYGGTGIGLALCRKIVQYHAGQIWLADVESGQGATFRFTLPEGKAFAQSRY
ncbi:ATP-binding protein [uncultured Jatrophihabitans sp.]|uniref:sensor histidine kinase n=1 Tax=uncultured Jatrophihabitans sp. TaxID=1610747 RepID=UPI0035CAFC74